MEPSGKTRSNARPSYEKLSGWLKENLSYFHFTAAQWRKYQKGAWSTLPRPSFNIPMYPSYHYKEWTTWEAFNGFNPNNDRTEEFLRKIDGRRGTNRAKIPRSKRPRKLNSFSKVAIAKEKVGRGNVKDFDLQLFTKGDSKQFEIVFYLYHKILFYYTCHFILDEEQANDIVATAYQKLWIDREKFQTLEHVKKYLYKVCHNQSANLLLEVKRRRKSHNEISYLETEEDRNPDPQYEFIRAEVIAAIYKELENLPAKAAAKAFKLIVIDGKRSDDVAEQMGITRKTALNLKLNAAGLLREKFQSSGRLWRLIQQLGIEW